MIDFNYFEFHHFGDGVGSGRKQNYESGNWPSFKVFVP